MLVLTSYTPRSSHLTGTYADRHGIAEDLHERIESVPPDELVKLGIRCMKCMCEVKRIQSYGSGLHV